MIGALENLEEDHRLIERALAVLERAAGLLKRGEEVAPETLALAVSFVRGFADGVHHGKEEDLLFPLLATKGPAIEGGPVRVLSADHEKGRKLMHDLERSIDLMRAGRPEGREAAHKALTTYTHMLRRHIAKEDDILFPLSEGLITTAEAQKLEEQFELVERESGERGRERYEAMVEELETAVDLPP